MARKTLTKPRKNATQDRSRMTVDALIEATARILVRDGFDKASTNRIAEEAGVSIGSLYQYFPGKEALVVAVIERHTKETMKVVQAALAKVSTQPVKHAVRRLVTAAIEAHRIDPALHRVLAEQIPHTGSLENVEVFNREIFTLFRTYLEDHRDELRMVDLSLAAYVCVTSIEALAHTSVLRRPAMLADEGLDILIDEATRLVSGYLLPSA